MTPQVYTDSCPAPLARTPPLACCCRWPQRHADCFLPACLPRLQPQCLARTDVTFSCAPSPPLHCDSRPLQPPQTHSPIPAPFPAQLFSAAFPLILPACLCLTCITSHGLHRPQAVQHTHRLAAWAPATSARAELAKPTAAATIPHVSHRRMQARTTPPAGLSQWRCNEWPAPPARPAGKRWWTGRCKRAWRAVLMSVLTARSIPRLRVSSQAETGILVGGTRRPILGEMPPRVTFCTDLPAAAAPTRCKRGQPQRPLAPRDRSQPPAVVPAACPPEAAQDTHTAPVRQACAI